MGTLRSRLASLRPTVGQVPGSASDCDAEEAPSGIASFRDRLGRHALTTRRSKPRCQSRLSDEALADRIEGRLVSAGLIRCEVTLPFSTRHGSQSIGEELETALEFFGHERGTVVFMDTETTGLAGGTGTVIFLLGLARIVHEGLHLAQLLMTTFAGESALLKAAREFIEGAGTLVSYNGKSFDHPLLTTRYRLAGMADPFDCLTHIDLLHHTRRAFRNAWPDCSLRTAERRLLVLDRVNDLPGAEAPQCWFDWIRFGTPEGLVRVIEHNRADVLSLAALPRALRHGYENPQTMRTDIGAVARHYHRQSDESAAYEYLLAHRAHLDARAALDLARLARRRGNWTLAVKIWQELSRRDDHEALERLAKYYEHVARDIATALVHTRRLRDLDGAEERHLHRERRLLARGAEARLRT